MHALDRCCTFASCMHPPCDRSGLCTGWEVVGQPRQALHATHSIRWWVGARKRPRTARASTSTSANPPPGVPYASASGACPARRPAHAMHARHHGRVRSGVDRRRPAGRPPSLHDGARRLIRAGRHPSSGRGHYPLPRAHACMHAYDRRANALCHGSVAVRVTVTRTGVVLAIWP